MWLTRQFMSTLSQSVTCYVIITCLSALVHHRAEGHGHGTSGQEQPAGGEKSDGAAHAQANKLDSKHVHDQDHLKEHLKEQIDVSKMSESDQQFYYFKVHDSDNNDRLDGIELSNAMAHYHDEESGDKHEEYTEEELGAMVDQILDEDDLNKDGYIDYPEFIQSQKREEDDEEAKKPEAAK